MAEAPTYQSFPVMSGDEIVLSFTVTDNDGAAVDLTGGSGRFAMARNKNSSSNLAIDSDTAQASVIVTNLTGGLVDVTIPDQYTEPLVNDYYWEFKWTDSSGREAIVARGIMTVEKNLL